MERLQQATHGDRRRAAGITAAQAILDEIDVTVKEHEAQAGHLGNRMGELRHAQEAMRVTQENVTRIEVRYRRLKAAFSALTEGDDPGPLSDEEWDRVRMDSDPITAVSDHGA